LEEKIVYFDKPGKDNTEQVIQLVLERAKTRGIDKIVVASTRGNTATSLSKAIGGQQITLVVIPWQFNFKDKGNPFPGALTDELRQKGHRVHFATMLFHTGELYGINTPQVMANLLRVFGHGTKVCIEILMMACDGGCVEAGEKVIVVAGTAGGADTAVLATAAPSTRLTSLKIHEIICKPML
jgi:uncharacterized protein